MFLYPCNCVQGGPTDAEVQAISKHWKKEKTNVRSSSFTFQLVVRCHKARLNDILFATSSDI